MATDTHIVERAQADSLRSIQVIYNDRLCPLNTPARDFIVKLSGKHSFQGLTAEQIILSWFLILKFGITYLSLKLNKITSKNTWEQMGIMLVSPTSLTRMKTIASPQGNTLT